MLIRKQHFISKYFLSREMNNGPLGNILIEHGVLQDVAPCGFIINRRFGGTCCLHLQVEEITLAKTVLDGG
jgi:hypothetical protein